jgi:hypothetical protein
MVEASGAISLPVIRIRCGHQMRTEIILETSVTLANWHGWWPEKIVLTSAAVEDRDLTTRRLPTVVAKEYFAFIFRIEESKKAAWSSALLPASCWFLAWLILQSADFQQTTRRYIPKGRPLHNNHCENIKSYNLNAADTRNFGFELPQFEVNFCDRNAQ